ncbi:MAG: phosphotransferase [Deltaproteobacteria bacterium]|nr:phosphotransferase [Deltaproteobacteria bacterium]
MTHIENTFIAYARHILGIAEEAMGRMAIKAITKGGSDRCFYRLSLPNGKSFLFMAYGRQQEENAYWAGIAAFLAELGVSVPAVYGHDPELGFVLMEDLGDRDLWSYRHEPWEIRRDLYRKVLQRISPLHIFAQSSPGKGNGGRSANLSPRSPRTMKGYDRELYRWEHDYFLEQFVRDVCRISLAEREGVALREELEALAGRLLVMGSALVHRDLQSQNIMICGGEPIFIDFQGLRRGSLFYDLGSLLCDAYVSLTEEERDELLRYAYELLNLDLDWTRFREGFQDGSAQRLMQALGAFGFLGLKKGKEAFLGHIPQGIENLCRMAAASERLPQLLKLAERCRNGVRLTNRHLSLNVY